MDLPVVLRINQAADLELMEYELWVGNQRVSGPIRRSARDTKGALISLLKWELES